jgi:hypothetical protein
MTIEIKNSGPEIAAVLIGDPKEPSEVKVLQNGETYHSTASTLTVVDDSYPGLKDRRAKDQAFAGRRKADPNVDQRQLKKAKPAADKPAEQQGKAVVR